MLLGTSRFLRSVWLDNILSYGKARTELELLPLNLLIGANASGKSNLVSILSLLASAPRDLQVPFREGGGVAEWIWKGADNRFAEVRAETWFPHLAYRLRFSAVAGRFFLVDEELRASGGPAEEGPFHFYRFEGGRAVLPVRRVEAKGSMREELILEGKEILREQSILAQRKDPSLYPELTFFGTQLAKARFYRDLDLGRTSPVRGPQRVDLPDDFLLEDASNLGLVLSDLLNRPATKKALLERLRRFYERVVDITVKVQGGTVQVFFHEEGLNTAVPAIRLSDGTLRYLCLLTILCHPEPPPLICIEEPESGLHPDVLPDLAELLVEASSRTQLVVTTHSDALVSALSDVPESVLVCERGEDGTTLRRLDKAHLAEWLERYRLGDLWRMGEIGGNRW